MTKKPPINTPKLRGYLAALKPVATLLYRKNHKITYMLRWDYRQQKDNLMLGSRFYGKLYPNRCDLSPDGEDFIYFALGGYDGKLWTGICTPPHLTTYYVLKNIDTYTGGGRFLNNRQVFVCPTIFFTQPSPKKQARYLRTKQDTLKQETLKYEIVHDISVLKADYYQTKGWTPIKFHDKGYCIIWEKKEQGIRLVMSRKEIEHYDGEFSDFTYAVYHNEQALLTNLPPIYWADFDLYHRLIIALGATIRIYPNLPALLANQYTELDIAELIAQHEANYKEEL